eukprot:5315079-Alexandrium_andersonii.AAC.1
MGQAVPSSGRQAGPRPVNCGVVRHLSPSPGHAFPCSGRQVGRLGRDGQLLNRVIGRPAGALHAHSL